MYWLSSYITDESANTNSYCLSSANTLGQSQPIYWLISADILADSQPIYWLSGLADGTCKRFHENDSRATPNLLLEALVRRAMPPPNEKRSSEQAAINPSRQPAARKLRRQQAALLKSLEADEALHNIPCGGAFSATSHIPQVAADVPSAAFKDAAQLDTGAVDSILVQCDSAVDAEPPAVESFHESASFAQEGDSCSSTDSEGFPEAEYDDEPLAAPFSAEPPLFYDDSFNLMGEAFLEDQDGGAAAGVADPGASGGGDVQDSEYRSVHDLDLSGDLGRMLQGGVFDQAFRIFTMPKQAGGHPSVTRFCCPRKVPTSEQYKMGDQDDEAGDIYTWAESAGRTVFPSIQLVRCLDGVLHVWTCDCVPEQAARRADVVTASSVSDWDCVSDVVCEHVVHLRDCAMECVDKLAEFDGQDVTIPLLDSILHSVQSTAPHLASRDIDGRTRRLFEFAGVGDNRRFFLVDLEENAASGLPGGMVLWWRWAGKNRVPTPNPHP